MSAFDFFPFKFELFFSIPDAVESMYFPGAWSIEGQLVFQIKPAFRLAIDFVCPWGEVVVSKCLFDRSELHNPAKVFSDFLVLKNFFKSWVWILDLEDEDFIDFLSLD